MSTRRLTVAVVSLLLAWAASGQAGMPTVTHDGRAYVELARVAASLQKTKLDASAVSTRAHLRTGDRVVTLTRNWAQVLVDGKPVLLDAPVRVKRGVWLVPESFVDRVVPALTRVAGETRVASETRVVAVAAVEITLEDVRVRSYPSFTRIVVETSAPIAHRIETSGPREARIRLTGLSGGAHAEEPQDGLIAEVRLERAGPDGLLRVVFEGAAGTIRATTLVDPPRLVLDVARPVEPTARPGRERLTPLRTIVLDAGHGGHDSGAVGPTGLMEKDLVLDVTRRVGKLVEERLLLQEDADAYIKAARDRRW